MAIRVRLCLGVWTASLLAGTAGCGVADYQARMVSAQDRVQRWEEMNRLLDAPLAMPVKQEKDVSTPLGSLHLRPPRGVQAQPSKEQRAGVMTTYAPALQGGAEPFAYLEIAFAPIKTRGFEAKVLACFPAPARPARRQREVRPIGRDPLTFTSVEFDDAAYAYAIHFFKGPRTQTAVAFWVNKGGKAQAVRPAELCLETFGLDADVAAARSAQANPLAVPGHPR